MSIEEIDERIKKIRLIVGDPLTIDIYNEFTKYKKLIRFSKSEKDKERSLSRLKWLISKYEKDLR